jgi:soluble lytic murein transglycosylase-like protein
VKYDAEVARATAHWGVSPALVHAVIEVESSHGLKLVTVEPRGHLSYGPMMVLDSTATSVLGVKDPSTLKDPATGIWYGTQYLASLISWAGGNINKAVSAYNAGKGNARPNPAGIYPNQGYIVRVLGAWNRFKRAAVASAPVAVPLLLLLMAALIARRRRAA